MALEILRFCGAERTEIVQGPQEYMGTSAPWDRPRRPSRPRPGYISLRWARPFQRQPAVTPADADRMARDSSRGTQRFRLAAEDLNRIRQPRDAKVVTSATRQVPNSHYASCRITFKTGLDGHKALGCLVTSLGFKTAVLVRLLEAAMRRMTADNIAEQGLRQLRLASATSTPSSPQAPRKTSMTAIEKIAHLIRLVGGLAAMGGRRPPIRIAGSRRRVSCAYLMDHLFSPRPLAPCGPTLTGGLADLRPFIRYANAGRLSPRRSTVCTFSSPRIERKGNF
jgi:hypothetical protein